MARSYRGVGTIRWGAQDGKDGVNYLIMGWWSASVHYKLTDAGIPVVKVEDTSPDKFSVYKLTALQSTLGLFIASEWEKVKSADFVYMQDAYIERLQASIITAEYISSILIKTGKLEVLSGAKIAGLNIYDNAIASYPDLGSIVPPGEHIHVSKAGVSIDRNVGMSQNQVLTSVRATHDGIRVSKSDSDGNKSMEVRIDGIYIDGVKLSDGGGGGYTHPPTHPASMITTGTFEGIVKANNNTSYTTKQVRNMILSTGSPVSSQMENGDIWIKYE